MAYGLKYTFTFQDEIQESPATWRLDWEKKDYIGAVDTFPMMGESPISLIRSADDESKLSPIVGSKMSINCLYDGVSSVPHPNEFRNIEEDVYRVSLYRNDVMYFRGFVKPDAASYPFQDPPYAYQVNVTDYFNGMKSKVMNLNLAATGLFYYTHLSLASILDRTLFEAVDYDGAAVKILHHIKPDILTGFGNLVDETFMHADAFYSTDEGPMKIYEALKRIMIAYRSRIFFSNGYYWIQRLADLYKPYSDVLMYANTGSVTFPPEPKPVQIYKTDFQVVAGSGTIGSDPAIFSQKVKYQLKAINQIANFTWEAFSAGVPADWTTSDLFTRWGAGTAVDPYRLRFVGTNSMYQEIATPVVPGQRVQLQLRVVANYAKTIFVGVTLGTSGEKYVMDSGGNWIPRLSGSTDRTLFQMDISQTDFTGKLDITSFPIPEDTPVSERVIVVRFDGITPSDSVPGGQTPSVDVYPPFLRIFRSMITRREGDTVNGKVYSYIPDDEEGFFHDTNDPYISNTIFVNDGGNIVPVEPFTWRDLDTAQLQSVDYYAGRTILDNYNVCSDTFEGTIRSNTLDFHQTILLPPINGGSKLVQIGDTYDIKKGLHNITAQQIFDKNTGVGFYTIRSFTN